MGMKLNGNYVAAANCTIRIDRDLFTDTQELNITSKIDPVFVKAIGSPVPVGRTDGEEEASGDITMPAQQMAFLRKRLAAKHSSGSYGLVEFDIRVQMNNGRDPIVEVVARKCRLLEDPIGFKAGDATQLNSKSGLSIMWVERDGLRLINPASTAFEGFFSTGFSLSL